MCYMQRFKPSKSSLSGQNTLRCCARRGFLTCHMSTRPSRSDERVLRPPCRCVIKLGGAALTNKSVLETLQDDALAAVAGTVAMLHQQGGGVVIVHGAGSFGHHQVCGELATWFRLGVVPHRPSRCAWRMLLSNQINCVWQQAQTGNELLSVIQRLVCNSIAAVAPCAAASIAAAAPSPSCFCRSSPAAASPAAVPSE